ncbi:MAG: FKBP-type peptidyl-prolyl cis-trans isomerase [Bradymonadales bacterium]|nr:FKBP-type peptidyl-prolyl cis-trans isomerase [Bradymonadales bacterium]
MKVEKGKKIVMEYEIAIEGGEILESSHAQGPLEYIHGDGRMLPGLEARIEGLSQGDQQEGSLPPQEAFGSLTLPTQTIDRQEFPEDADLQEGMHFEALNLDGDRVRFQVLSVEEDLVQVRYEHPLADKTIHYKVTILDVSEAEESKEAGPGDEAPPLAAEESAPPDESIAPADPETAPTEQEGAPTDEESALLGEVDALKGEVQALAGTVEALEEEVEALEEEVEPSGPPDPDLPKTST